MSLENHPELQDFFENHIDPLNSESDLRAKAASHLEKIIGAWEEGFTNEYEMDLCDSTLDRLFGDQDLLPFMRAIRSKTESDQKQAQRIFWKAYSSEALFQIETLLEEWVGRHPALRADSLGSAA